MSSRPHVSIAAVRGAIQVRANRADDIRDATARLLTELLAANRLTMDHIVSAVFTATPDLNADFPAHAARRLGWRDVPLLGAVEIAVPHALPRVVRVLLTVHDVPRGRRLQPVYLDGAEALRPDLSHARGGVDAGEGLGGPADEPRDEPVRVPAVPRDRHARHTVAIVGLGQIGGSLGLALGRAGGWRRVGYDRGARVRQSALEVGAVDAIAGSLAEACAGADLVVLATPVDVLPGLIGRAAAAMRRGAALMDTGSARAGITGALAEAARHGVRAVGGHPIAGSEGRGLAAARGDLFVGAPFVLMPAAGRVPAIARTLVRDVGARALVVSPAEHDAALARTSHLPYVLACALAGVGGDAARRHLAGPGYRSMTRLAASDPRVAGAFVRANARQVRAAWKALRADVERRLGNLER